MPDGGKQGGAGTDGAAGNRFSGAGGIVILFCGNNAVPQTIKSERRFLLYIYIIIRSGRGCQGCPVFFFYNKDSFLFPAFLVFHAKQSGRTKTPFPGMNREGVRTGKREAACQAAAAPRRVTVTVT